MTQTPRPTTSAQRTLATAESLEIRRETPPDTGQGEGADESTATVTAPDRDRGPDIVIDLTAEPPAIHLPEPRRRRRKTWILRLILPMLLLLGSVEAAVRAVPVDDLWPRSSIGSFLRVEALVRPVSADASIMVLGSSRVRDAVSPRTLEESIGLPEGAIVNFAVTDGHALDSLLVFDRNAAELSQLEHVVIGVETWEFWEPADQARAMALGGPLTRRAFDVVDHASAIVSSTSRLVGYRRLLAGAIADPFEGRKPIRLRADGRTQYRAAIERGPAVATDLPERAARLEPITELDRPRGTFPALRVLVDEAKARGLTVTLLHVPVRDEWVEIVEERSPGRIDGFLAALERLDVCTISPISAGEVGLGSVDFVDYGHASDQGAWRFSTWLGPELARCI